MNIVMTYCVKDEIEFMEMSLIFHKKLGVTHFLVTDTGSSDGTRELLDKYKVDGYIDKIFDEKSDVFYHKDIVHKMDLYAKNELHADWIINADGDEFFFPHSLDFSNDIAQNTNCNCLKCKMQDAIPFNGDNPSKKFYDDNYFVTRYLNDYEMKKYDIKSGIYSNTRNYKAILKADDYIEVVAGNHDARMKNKTVALVSNISLFHYNILSYDHFEKKVKKQEALINNPNKKLSGHMRYFFEQYKKGNLKAVFNDYLHLDKKELLLSEGIVCKNTAIKNFIDKFIQN